MVTSLEVYSRHPSATGISWRTIIAAADHEAPAGVLCYMYRLQTVVSSEADFAQVP